MNPRRLIEDLAGLALMERHCDSRRMYGLTVYEQFTLRGKEIPERLLPGRFIQNYVKPGDRATLSELKGEDTTPGGLMHTQIESGRWSK